MPWRQDPLFCLRAAGLCDSISRVDGGDDEQLIIADRGADGAAEAVLSKEPRQAARR